jgi:hypothetical protein
MEKTLKMVQALATVEGGAGDEIWTKTERARNVLYDEACS